MLVWNPEGVDDAIWESLRKHFSEQEIIELGYFVALTYGQQRWIKTLGIEHGEVLADATAGLGPGKPDTHARPRKPDKLGFRKDDTQAGSTRLGKTDNLGPGEDGSRLGANPNEVRGRVPAVLSSYLETREEVLLGGVVEDELKERCARFLVGEPIEPRDERERAAFDWAYAIAWDSDRAAAELWERLHRQFSEPELVELGYAIAFMLGQQHWARTLGLPPEIAAIERAC